MIDIDCLFPSTDVAGPTVFVQQLPYFCFRFQHLQSLVLWAFRCLYILLNNSNEMEAWSGWWGIPDDRCCRLVAMSHVDG